MFIMYIVYAYLSHNNNNVHTYIYLYSVDIYITPYPAANLAAYSPYRDCNLHVVGTMSRYVYV